MISKRQKEILGNLHELKEKMKRTFSGVDGRKQLTEALEHIRKLEDIIYASVGREFEDTSLENVVKSYVKQEYPTAKDIIFTTHFKTEDMAVNEHHLGNEPTNTSAYYEGQATRGISESRTPLKKKGTPVVEEEYEEDEDDY
jgi:hypothetical protein